MPPVSVTPLVPARIAEIVVVWLLTVIFGAPVPPVLSKVRTLAAFPLLSRNQLLVAVVSPNNRRPIVRGLSKLTVESAVILSVEKLAWDPAPLAITPPVHFVPSLHNPVPFPAKPVGFQVPSAACAHRDELVAKAEAQRTTNKTRF